MLGIAFNVTVPDALALEQPAPDVATTEYVPVTDVEKLATFPGLGLNPPGTVHT